MTSEDAYSDSVNAIVKDVLKLDKFRSVFSKPDSNFRLVALEYEPEACICSTIYVYVMRLDDTWRAIDFEGAA